LQLTLVLGASALIGILVIPCVLVAIGGSAAVGQTGVKDPETLISSPVRGTAAMQEANFVADSVLEETGFEPSVPLGGFAVAHTRLGPDQRGEDEGQRAARTPRYRPRNGRHSVDRSRDGRACTDARRQDAAR